MYDFLKDLKVVELAAVLAGPAVGRFFAELGATVIKVENKRTGGDITRRWKLQQEDSDSPVAAYYYSVNMGKESLLLDLRAEEDRARVYDLIREADVVLSNFKSNSASKLGMDYEQLKAINPRIVYGHLTAFGAHSARPAFDVVLQAEAGLLYMNGAQGGEAVKLPLPMIDILAGHHLKEGILLALWNRERTGQGALVESSLIEAAIASLANQATNWLMVQHIPRPTGNEHSNIAPYGDVFYSKDEKPIVIAAGTEQQFVALCQLLELEQLLEDDRFRLNPARVKHRNELNIPLQEAFRKWNRAELLLKLEHYNVPAGSIRNMQEVFEMETAKAMIQEEQQPDGRLARSVKTVAFKIS